MNYVHSAVAFLEGKKTLILSIAGITLSYLVKDGNISAALGTSLQAVISVLGVGTVAVGSTAAYKAFIGAKSTPKV